MKAVKMKRYLFLFIVALITVAVSSQHAISQPMYDYDWSDPNQSNEGCGHIAVANILDYWDSSFPSLVPQDFEPNLDENQADALSRELQKRTELSPYLGPGRVDNLEMWSGIRNWFQKRRVGLRMKQQGMYEGEIPSWSFYQSEHARGEKILILLDWGGVNHWLAGFCLETNPNKFVVHDPNVSGRNEQQYAYTVDADGYMHVQYTLGTQTYDAKITQLISVTALPEPATICLLALGTLGLVVIRYRRHCTARMN